MDTKALYALIGKTITLCDRRTNDTYTTVVKDAKLAWGRLLVTVAEDRTGDVTWFEPTRGELKTTGVVEEETDQGHPGRELAV